MELELLKIIDEEFKKKGITLTIDEAVAIVKRLGKIEPNIIYYPEPYTSPYTYPIITWEVKSGDVPPH